MQKKRQVISKFLVCSLLISMFGTTGAYAKKSPSISVKKVTLQEGEKKKITLKNVKGKVKWKSSSSRIASVSSTGKVVAKKKGKAQIIAIYKKKKYICKVTVVKKTTQATSKKSETPKPISAQNMEKQWEYISMGETLKLTRYLGNQAEIQIPSQVDGKMVTCLEEYLFANNRNLQKVTIPNSITQIGEGAFYNCTSLTEVDMANSVEKIGKKVFYNCKKLQKIHFSEALEEIPRYTFAGCTSLISFEFSNKVKRVLYASFFRSGITEMHIPASVEKLEWAFGEELMKLYFPQSLKELVVRFDENGHMLANSAMRIFVEKDSTLATQLRQDLAFEVPEMGKVLSWTNCDVEDGYLVIACDMLGNTQQWSTPKPTGSPERIPDITKDWEVDLSCDNVIDWGKTGKYGTIQRVQDGSILFCTDPRDGVEGVSQGEYENGVEFYLDSQDRYPVNISKYQYFTITAKAESSFRIRYCYYDDSYLDSYFNNSIVYEKEVSSKDIVRNEDGSITYIYEVNNVFAKAQGKVRAVGISIFASNSVEYIYATKNMKLYSMKFTNTRPAATPPAIQSATPTPEITPIPLENDGHRMELDLKYRAVPAGKYAAANVGVEYYYSQNNDRGYRIQATKQYDTSFWDLTDIDFTEIKEIELTLKTPCQLAVSFYSTPLAEERDWNNRLDISYPCWSGSYSEREAGGNPVPGATDVEVVRIPVTDNIRKQGGIMMEIMVLNESQSRIPINEETQARDWNKANVLIQRVVLVKE